MDAEPRHRQACLIFIESDTKGIDGTPAASKQESKAYTCIRPPADLCVAASAARSTHLGRKPTRFVNMFSRVPQVAQGTVGNHP